jgi:hypothetical protein
MINLLEHLHIGNMGQDLLKIPTFRNGQLGYESKRIVVHAEESLAYE